MPTLATIAKIIRRDKKCFYCPTVFITAEGAVNDATIDIATVDHLWPESRLGSNSPRNLVAACHSCNSKRGDYVPDAYADDACCIDHALRMVADTSARPEWLTLYSPNKLQIHGAHLKRFLEALYIGANKKIMGSKQEKADKVGSYNDSSPEIQEFFVEEIAEHYNRVTRP